MFKVNNKNTTTTSFTSLRHSMQCKYGILQIHMHINKRIGFIMHNAVITKVYIRTSSVIVLLTEAD